MNSNEKSNRWPLTILVPDGDAAARGEVRALAAAGLSARVLEPTDAGETGTAGRFVEPDDRAAASIRFLAEAGAVLGSSLDYESTLADVARLAVPRIGDWCTVDVLESGDVVRRVAVAHVDPSKVRTAWELDKRYPLHFDDPRDGVARALRSGNSELHPVIADKSLVAGARDAEHLRLLRSLGIRSVMIVPLLARGRVLGAITFVNTETARPFGPADLSLAEDLARRAASAVDNARLYRDLGEERRVAESLHRLGQMVAAELDVRKLVQTVTDEARALTGAGFGAFFYNVVDEQGESYTLYTLSGVGREAFEKFPMPRNTDLFGPTFRNEGIVRCDDVTKDPRYGRNAPHAGMPEGHLPVRSYLAAPVASRSGHVLGGLFLGHPEPGVFSPRDERLVAGVAAQAAVAIDNARLYEAAVADVRHRQEAMAALQSSEARYRALTEAVPQLVWTARPDGQCDYLSRQWVQYTGVPEIEQHGLCWLQVLHPDDRPRAQQMWEDARAGRSPYDLEYRIRRHDGVYRWFETRGLPLREGASGGAESAEPGQPGRVVKWFGTCTDIDDQKRAEQELKAAKDQAEAANAAKDQFLAVLSHELRTPLTPVLTTVQALEAEAGLSPDLRGSLEMIRRNVELEARLIDDLLDLTRIAKNKLELNLQTVDVHETLRTALDICAEDVRAKRQTLRAELGAARRHVMGDSARLHQVFWNLIKNAVKFTPEGGQITIRTANEAADLESDSSPSPSLSPSPAAPRRIIVEVRDNGVGIEPNVLPRIFDAFEQGERSVTRKFGGLGLGLAISKVLVDMHGGLLTAASEGSGRGAVFVVGLAAIEPPAVRSAAGTQPGGRSSSDRPAADSRAEAGNAKLRILLVDDHEDTTRAMGRLLQAWGHTVRTANTVGSALDTVRGGTAETLLNVAGPDRPPAADRPTGNTTRDMTGSTTPDQGAKQEAEPGAKPPASEVPFDLLISDIGLPDGSGLELIRELHRMYPKDPVRGIALSGFGMEEDVKKSREAGFYAHLTKPVDFQKLRAVIRQATAG